MFWILYNVNSNTMLYKIINFFKTSYTLLLYYINPSHTFLYFYVLVFLWSLYYHNNNNKKTFKLEIYSVSFIGLSLRQYAIRHIAIGSFQQLLWVEVCYIFDDSITKRIVWKYHWAKIPCCVCFSFFFGIRKIFIAILLFDQWNGWVAL